MTTSWNMLTTESRKACVSKDRMVTGKREAMGYEDVIGNRGKSHEIP